MYLKLDNVIKLLNIINDISTCSNNLNYNCGSVTLVKGRVAIYFTRPILQHLLCVCIMVATRVSGLGVADCGQGIDSRKCSGSGPTTWEHAEATTSRVMY